MNRYHGYGAAFLVGIVAFLSFTVAVYEKVFTPAVHVTLKTDSVGNQLTPGADVKVRGVVVGEVRSVSTDGGVASLDLALQPDLVDQVPENVTARLLPKTLFGERYVSLQLPRHPAAPIQAGAVIGQDRSSSAIEISKVLDDLMPVLQAVQPQKLAGTLTALSQALDGRGKQLGDVLSQADSYLRQLAPSLPDLNADLDALSRVADTYSAAAPDFLHALSDLTTTSKTLVDQRSQLDTLYSVVTTTSVDLDSFLRVNQTNVIGLAASAAPTLAVLAKYAPEYPCVLGQLADQLPNADFTFGKGTDHPQMGKFTLTITASRGAYQPGVDTPKYLDTRGPRCYQKASSGNLFPQYPPGGPIQDGSTHPGAGGSSQSGTGSGSGPTGSGAGSAGSGTGLAGSGAGSTGSPASTNPAGAAVAGSPAEQQLLNLLEAPQLGLMPQQTPGWSALLIGPLLRGSEVTLK
jgi:virulence factor Mce-like protein